MHTASDSWLRQFRTTLIAGIQLLNEDGWLYERLFLSYHYLFFIHRHKRIPQAKQQRFNDYHFFRKINGTLRDPLKRHVTDKEHGKQFVSDHVGTGRTMPTLAILQNHAEIDAYLPSEFPVVIKPTHSSNRICFIHQTQDYLTALPKLHQWLEHDFFLHELEHNYAGLEKKLIVEPYLDNAFYLEGSIHCRQGSARIISVIDRFDKEKRRESFDQHWQALHVALGQPYQELHLPSPPFLEQLLKEAELLAQNFDFVRVDFYASETDFIFGELTNLPGGGLARFSSEEGEQRFNKAFFDNDQSLKP